MKIQLLFGVVHVAAAIQQVFYYSQSFTVPLYVNKIQVSLYGAQGGAGENCGVQGGLGYAFSGVLQVSVGQVLAVNVGGMGATGAAASTAPGGYNYGGTGNNGGGGGGGRSDIQRSGSLLAVAAGGGGAFCLSGQTSRSGGAGGDQFSGAVGGGLTPGGGATSSSGGSGGYCSCCGGAGGGSYAQGGWRNSGGGGGGGLYGGGGGVCASGGGGGSSYFTGTNYSPLSRSSGNGQVIFSYEFEIPPTFRPTAVPTAVPTVIPSVASTVVPTLIPTVRPSTFSPSAGPTEFVATMIASGGNYEGTSANDVFTVNSLSNVTVSGKGGRNTYVIVPHSGVWLTITDFSSTHDLIDLKNFDSLYSVKDIKIVFDSPSTKVHLPLGKRTQAIVFVNSVPVSSSFVFGPSPAPTAAPAISDQSTSHSSTSVAAVIGAVLGPLGGIIGGMGTFYKLCSSAAMSYNNQLLNGALETDGSFTPTMFITSYYGSATFHICSRFQLFSYLSVESMKELKHKLMELYQHSSASGLSKDDLKEEVTAFLAEKYKDNFILSGSEMAKIMKHLKQVFMVEMSDFESKVKAIPQRSLVGSKKVLPIQAQAISYPVIYAVHDIVFDNPHIQKAFAQGGGLLSIKEHLDSWNSVASTVSEIPHMQRSNYNPLLKEVTETAPLLQHVVKSTMCSAVPNGSSFFSKVCERAVF